MSTSFVTNPEVRVAISNKHLPKKNNKSSNKSNQNVEQKLIQFSEHEIEILKKVEKLSELDESPPPSPRENRIKSNKKDKVTEFTIPQIKKLKSELDNSTFLCDLIDFSAIKLKLPENEIIPRNPELEKRIQRLKAEQEQRTYENMTRNIDSGKARLPEDSIAFQCKLSLVTFAVVIAYKFNRFSETHQSTADCSGAVCRLRTRRILVRLRGHSADDW